MAKILIIDDEENILASLKGGLEDEGHEVETANNGALGLQKLKKFSPDVILLDIWMPGEDGIQTLSRIKYLDHSSTVIMMSGHASVESAVKTIKMGAFDFLEKPLHFDKLLLLVTHALELKSLRNENQFLREELKTEEQLIGHSKPIQKLNQLITVTAPSNGWVLIQGENGTGKELVARALHQGSPRSQERFVAVNCAAIPDELIESELFGHEKGSFTGAVDRKIGKFEQAHLGTLFLDEVGDMSPKMQAKILRALQEGKVQRVGGDRLIEVDIRVIAATNKDLRRSIRSNEFREDLYYRLKVIPIIVPALRERKEDIPLLIQHFMRRFSPGKKRRLGEDTINLLQNYAWPGNVRELKNWVERACILSEQDSLDEVTLDELNASDHGDDSTNAKSLKLARATFEKQFIEKMLTENDCNITKTAQLIGVERSHLSKKIKSYGIELPGVN